MCLCEENISVIDILRLTVCMCCRNTQQRVQMCLQSPWGKFAINAKEKIEIE